MIIDTTLNGRPCTAMYMTRAFEPVDNEDDAELIKVRFMDEQGGVLFLVPQREELVAEEQQKAAALSTELMLDRDQAQALKDRWQEQSKDLHQGGTPILRGGLKVTSADRIRMQRWEVARARALQLLQRFDPDQPRDEQGRWTTSGGAGGIGGGLGGGLGSLVVPRPTGNRAAGAKERISTTVPSAAAAKKQGIGQLNVSRMSNYDSFKQAMKTTAPGGKDPKTGQQRPPKTPFRDGINKLMDRYGKTGSKDHPPFVRFPENATPEQKAEAFVEHVKSNVKALYRAYGDYRERAKLWYQGANKIAGDLANEYSTEDYEVSQRGVAGVIAQLSPQRDWDQNVTVAKRVLDIAVKNRDVPITGQAAANTRAAMDGYIAEQRAKIEEINAELASDEAKSYSAAKKRGREDTIQNAQDVIADLERLMPMVEGKTLSQIGDFSDQAMIVRFYDEGNAPPDRSYPLWNPEGMMSDKVGRNKPTPAQEAAGEPGDLRQAGWSSFVFIENSLRILNDDSPRNISELLGEQFKIRNFYNNIVSPDFGQDATIDTHAIAGGTLMPLGGSDLIVTEGLGGAGPGNAETGLSGTYALYHEGYRRAASDLSEEENREILPREMQSITWEALRGLFEPSEKSDPVLEREINGIWKEYHDGDISLEAAQNRIIGRGIRPPRWA